MSSVLSAIQKMCREATPSVARPLGIVIPPGRVTPPEDLKPAESDWEKPANKWVRDPLIDYDYLRTYPRNPFIDVGKGRI